MENRISIYDFYFGTDGASNYYATYTSPTTGKFWTSIISKERIDEVRANPTQQSLTKLMNYCKRNGSVNALYLTYAY